MTDEEFIKYLLAFIAEDLLGETHTDAEWDNINAEMKKRQIKWEDIK